MSARFLAIVIMATLATVAIAQQVPFAGQPTIVQVQPGYKLSRAATDGGSILTDRSEIEKKKGGGGPPSDPLSC